MDAVLPSLAGDVVYANVRANTGYGNYTVPYRANRIVIFNSNLFHKVRAMFKLCAVKFNLESITSTSNAACIRASAPGTVPGCWMAVLGRMVMAYALALSCLPV